MGPEDGYRPYHFVRQSQRFPDVVLKRKTTTGADDILFGIELKGWYLLAKEKEPSLRFLTDPEACAPADLLAVVPWALSNVLSGTPVVFDPWTESARYAAEYRNYHWSERRKTKLSRDIRRPEGAKPYPQKADQVADAAVADQGNNFGRLARTGLMDRSLATSMAQDIVGVPASVWVEFFKGAERPRPTEPHMVSLSEVSEE